MDGIKTKAPYYKGLLALLATVFISGCESTPKPNELEDNYPDVTIAPALLAQKDFQRVVRHPPRYPRAMAESGTMGCASVELVLSPDYRLLQLRVIEQSTPEFGQAAYDSVRRWHWGSVTEGLLSETTKTVTRMNFCLEDGSGRCPQAISDNCPGSDVLNSIGYKIRG
ncbi:energy transducer TonB [Paraferrimonas haliotis]|uniref:TonB C-terminal domain-containing protein n=1 Tax=Paraferrimonas haliotis TaxID=2013866 RepID=A0AA37WXD2_9GAMM|nr:energy transducer TonB [Paraferrimonas haliotis]GLS83329.1 hypothetical protein GCM10007894_13060 [Paraferrimonas haliotis]